MNLPPRILAQVSIRLYHNKVGTNFHLANVIMRETLKGLLSIKPLAIFVLRVWLPGFVN